MFIYLFINMFIIPLFAKIALSTLSSEVLAASNKAFNALVLDWKKWKKRDVKKRWNVKKEVKCEKNQSEKKWKIWYVGEIESMEWEKLNVNKKVKEK